MRPRQPCGQSVWALLVSLLSVDGTSGVYNPDPGSWRLVPQRYFGLSLQRRQLAARLCQSAAAREPSAWLGQHERAHIRAPCIRIPLRCAVWQCKTGSGRAEHHHDMEVDLDMYSMYVGILTSCRLMHRDKSPSRRRSLATYWYLLSYQAWAQCYPRGTCTHEVEQYFGSTSTATRCWASQYLP